MSVNIVLIILISILIILSLIILYIILIKSNDSKNVENFVKFENNINNKLSDFQYNTTNIIAKSSKYNIDTIFKFNNKLKEELNQDFSNLNKIVNDRLDKISSNIENRLENNFSDNKRTFVNIIESISRLDEAQKKMDDLSNNVMNLNNILLDKKTRGVFGEIQLYQILSSIFGENEEIYKKQYRLPNNYISDAVLFAPEPLGTICIDSKFPLENYRNIFNKNKEYEKLFEQNIKKHIDDISRKYILDGLTTNQAILFLPAEAIFAYIYANMPNIVEYAYNKKVWITSPTTIMAVLTTIQAILQNIKQSKYASEIQRELIALSLEFERYEKRWELLDKDIDKITKDVKDIYKTSNKISRKFNHIKTVDEKIE